MQASITFNKINCEQKKILIKIKSFQCKETNWSILYLGRVPRIKIARVTKNILLINMYNYKKKMTAPIKIAKKTNVSIRANAIKDVLNKFSASSGFLAAPTLYPANNTPVPIAAPAKVTEISPSAINLDAVIANKLWFHLH